MYSVFFIFYFLLFWEEVRWYCEDICATKRKNVQQNYNKTIVKWVCTGLTCLFFMAENQLWMDTTKKAAQNSQGMRDK